MEKSRSIGFPYLDLILRVNQIMGKRNPTRPLILLALQISDLEGLEAYARKPGRP